MVRLEITPVKLDDNGALGVSHVSFSHYQQFKLFGSFHVMN